jgi:putative spermidine/putrescine transport system permease protein
VVSVISVATGFYISKSIAYHEKKYLFSFIAYLPFILSPVIYAACLNYFFVVAGLSGTIVGVMLAQFIIIFPFNIVLFLSHWNERMKSYSELVSTMGGNAMQTFWRVLVPVSMPVLFVALFQSFLISWFEFGLTYFIGTAQVQTLTIKVYQSIGEVNIHLAAYSSLLLIIPPLILLFLNRKIVFYTH